MQKDETAIARRMDVHALMQQAIDKGASVETMERLVALAKDMRAEMARAAWHEAMAGFQAEAPEIVKSKTARVNTAKGSYSYRYAPLDQIIPAVRPILSKYSLSAVFSMTQDERSVTATCKVSHADGHVESCSFTAPVDQEGRMNPAQRVASASTYARRYAYLAALGIAPEDDDDGASAGEPESRPVVAMPRRAEPPQDERPFDDAPLPEAQGGNVWTGTIKAVQQMTGKKKNGDPWALDTIEGEDGFRAGTFDAKLGEYARGHVGFEVEIVWEETKKGNKNVVEIRAL